MHWVTVNFMIACFKRSRAKDLMLKHTSEGDMNKINDKLSGQWIEPANRDKGRLADSDEWLNDFSLRAHWLWPREVSLFPCADLESATLGKPGHLATALLHTVRRPLHNDMRWGDPTTPSPWAGAATKADDPATAADRSGWETHYDVVAVAGTFDRLHDGHKAMLRAAARAARKKVILAVASSSLHERKLHKELIQPLNSRMATAAAFLRDMNGSIEVECVQLDDPIGLSSTSAEMQALVLSPETEGAIVKINSIRAENALSPLTAIIIDNVLDTEGKVVSSTQLRTVEAGKQGKM